MILCFSGCGNSLFVAQKLARELGRESIVRLFGDILLEAKLPGTSGSNNSEQALSSASVDNRVVWVMPVYSWGIPPVVAKFISSLTDSAELRQSVHHLVLTYGDDCGLAYKQWRNLIASRGWKTGSVSGLQMPNTYVLMKGFDVDSEKVADEKLKAAVSMISEIAERITTPGADTRLMLCKGKFAWVKTCIIYPWFKRFCMSPRPFRHTDACIRCGKCMTSCPMKNISMDSNGPRWSVNCALCLACYNVCPTHAVAYGKSTVGKGQYFRQSSENMSGN